MASDGSYIPAEVSRNSWIDIEVEGEQSMLSYLDDLDQELTSQPGFKKPPTRTVTKKITTSTTAPECSYIHHGSKRGVGYLMEATVDCKHGIITGVDAFPANEKESLLVLRHPERQKMQLGLAIEKVALDRGYDTGREMSARNALPVILVLIRPGCAEEFWSAAAIPRFTESM